MAYRVHKSDGYTYMCNHHLRDTSLSWQAKGMLSFMFSNREDFKYSINGLIQCASNGDSSVRSILNELKERGYLLVTPIRSSNGKIERWDYDFFESPESAEKFISQPDAENPHVELEHVENETQRNTNERNTNERTPLLFPTEISPQGEKPKRKNKSNELDFSKVDPAFGEVILEWLNYKRERKQRYTQSGFNQFYKRLIRLSGNNPYVARQMIEESMANNYQGIFELKQHGTTISKPTDAQLLKSAIDDSWGPGGDPLAGVL